MQIADLYPDWAAMKAYAADEIVKFGVNADGETQLYPVATHYYQRWIPKADFQRKQHHPSCRHLLHQAAVSKTKDEFILQQAAHNAELGELVNTILGVNE